ncbi:hypothetical protein HYV50_00690 [Candidatus Pacearchaeota archaeon]|nr:hypothetical protein [Candidatus Pacearchaeota archaeon]
MSSDNVLLTLAFLAVAVSVVGAGYSLWTVANFNDWLVGLSPGATTNQTIATVNITIVQNLAIEFTRDVINWGNGSVASAQTNANLTSEGQFDRWANLTPANVTSGFVLENVGNINGSLYVRTEKNATNFFFGPSGPIGLGEVAYQYKVRSCNTLSGVINCTVTGRVDDTADSCGFKNITFGVYGDVNAATTALGDLVCTNFGFGPETADALRIDVLITVPFSAAGTKGDRMIATAERQP